MSDRLVLPVLLLISDNPGINHSIRKHLEGRYFFLETGKSDEALLATQSSLLDLIILDSEFAEESPLELCKKLKRALKNAPVPILLITGRLKKSYRNEALEAGVADFLEDSLDAADIHAKVFSLQKTQHARKKTSEIAFGLRIEQATRFNGSLKEKLILVDRAIRMITSSKSQKNPIGLIFVQIDHLSAIKEKLKDSFEADILAPFSALSQSLLGKEDLFVPSTQGYFLYLLTPSSPERVGRFAKTLQKAIVERTFSSQKGDIHLTVSVALAPLDIEGSSFDQMIEAAAKALQTTKKLSNHIVVVEAP